MALISQSVKNLKGGISQQPDILRYPEQGAEQVNGWSSETEGLQKRPPLVFTKALYSANAFGDNPYVHLINRDDREQYYAVFTGTNIEVMDLQGNIKPVTIESDYHKCANPREDLRMVTVADYTFVVNTRKPTLHQDDKSWAGFRADGSALIVVRGGQYGRTLRVWINGDLMAEYTIPQGDKPDHVNNTDAQWLANELATQMRTKLSATGWKVEVGSGFIYVEAPANNNVNRIQTSDGYSDQLIYPVTHYVQSFAKLPQKAPDNYLVKIMGDSSASGDQYYVKYDESKKVWTEVIGWGVDQSVTDSSMPHALISNADGSFTFKTLKWEPRKAGDDDTNPWPSFVDNTINDVFFYRNRLGFLSGENIILSRTGKYFDFFPASVSVISDDDPIDVAVSHNRISILKYAVPFSEELLLWSDEAQFVLNSGGVLSSKSIQLDLTTQFNVQDRARPFGIGRNVYFASPRATYTSLNRYYAVQDVSSVKNAEDMTSHVPNYIPNGVFDIHGSATENFASILTTGAKNKIFIYKFKFIDEEIRQQAWSHWEFPEDFEIFSAKSIGSKMYIFGRNKFNAFLCTVNFTKNTIDLPKEPYRSFLDMKKEYVIPAGTYNDDTYLTTFSLHTVYGMHFVSGKITILEEDGKLVEFNEPEGGWSANPNISLHGNLEGRRIFIGFNIPFRYEFSKFLIKKTAEDGSIATEDIGRLQLRRAWVNYEESGAFHIEVDNQGRSFRYTMAGSRLGSNSMRVGKLNVGTGQFRFPVNGNAQYNTVRLVSDETTPLNIIGCGWEGNYIRRSSGI